MNYISDWGYLFDVVENMKQMLIVLLEVGIIKFIYDWVYYFRNGSVK